MPTGHKPSYSIISKKNPPRPPIRRRTGRQRPMRSRIVERPRPDLRSTANGRSLPPNRRRLLPMREIAIAPHCLRRGGSDPGERKSPRGNAGSRRAAGRIFTGPIRMRPPRAAPCPHPVLIPDRERLSRYPRPRGCPMQMRRSRFGITVLSERCLSMRLRFHRTISTKRYSDAMYTLPYFSVLKVFRTEPRSDSAPYTRPRRTCAASEAGCPVPIRRLTHGFQAEAHPETGGDTSKRWSATSGRPPESGRHALRFRDFSLSKSFQGRNKP